MQQSIGRARLLLTTNDGIVSTWVSADGNNGAPSANLPSYQPPGMSGINSSNIPMLESAAGGAVIYAVATGLSNALSLDGAQYAVQSINEGLDRRELDEQFVHQIRRVAANVDGDVSIDSIQYKPFVRNARGLSDVIELRVQYALSQDASALRATAIVTYTENRRRYRTRYDFDRETPASEKKGPLYRNSFVFHSDRLPAFTLTDETREALKVAIEEDSRTALNIVKSKYEEIQASDVTPGRLEDAEIEYLEARGSIRRAYQRALRRADDYELTSDEISILMIRRWLENDSAKLHNALAQAQAFIAETMLLDLNNSTVPTMAVATPQFEPGTVISDYDTRNLGALTFNNYTVLETMDQGRRVLRIESGEESGSYLSVPTQGVATYGNRIRNMDCDGPQSLATKCRTQPFWG